MVFAKQKYSNTAIQQYKNTAIQQYSNTAIQQYSNTAIQQYNNHKFSNKLIINMNFPILFAAALIPMVIGAIWYHPKVMGTTWMKASGVTEEQAQSGNMVLIFGLAYLFSFFLAFAINGLAIHQIGMFQLLGAEAVGSEAHTYLTGFMEKYGEMHRSFGHGALHGGIAAIIFALPLVGIVSLFERRGGKYILVHFGYWFIAMTLMGGVICQFA